MMRSTTDRDGAIVWEYRIGDGSAFGGQWGGGADERHVNVGASIDGAGPVIVDGMLFVNSGYNGIVGRSGNVLLACPQPGARLSQDARSACNCG
jgi:polyvinyl alcohol dehydrogenase (cytochrome)